MKVTVLAVAFLLLSVGLYTGQCMKELPFGHAKIDCSYSANATYSFASPPALGGRVGPDRIVSSTQQIMEDRRRRLQHADTLVVADILSVDLIGLDGFDKARISSCERFVHAWYRVEAHIRYIERGQFDFKRIVFAVKCDTVGLSTEYGEWLFCRGMTLKMSIKMVGGELNVDSAVACLPYPPYRTEDVYSFGSKNAYEFVDGLNEAVKDFFGKERDYLAIKYGDHTLAVYTQSIDPRFATTLNIKDFSTISKVYVWTSNEDAAPNWWSDAWFAECIDESDPIVKVVPLSCLVSGQKGTRPDSQ